MAVTSSADRRTVHLHRGDALKITLSEVKDGGFVWRTLVPPAREILATVSSTYLPSHLAPGEVGGSGTRIDRYRATGAGRTHVRLGSFGPESSTKPVGRFTLTVVVG